MPDGIPWNWVVTLTGLACCVLFLVYAGYKSGQPYNEERPHRLPWKLLVILSGFAAAMFIVHIINLFGYETGVDKGLLGRR